IVEQRLEARLGADAHVEVRLRRDPVGSFQLRPIDQLAVDRILDPEIVRRLTLVGFGLLLLQARPREIRQPIHCPIPSGFSPGASLPKSFGAVRTASLKSLTLRKTRRAASWAGPAAISSTKAEPTTTASAVLAIAAAASGSRTPKPTATGSVVARFSR